MICMQDRRCMLPPALQVWHLTQHLWAWIMVWHISLALTSIFHTDVPMRCCYHILLNLMQIFEIKLTLVDHEWISNDDKITKMIMKHRCFLIGWWNWKQKADWEIWIVVHLSLTELEKTTYTLRNYASIFSSRFSQWLAIRLEKKKINGRSKVKQAN